MVKLSFRISGKREDVVWAIGALCRKYGFDTTVVEAAKKHQAEREGKTLNEKELK